MDAFYALAEPRRRKIIELLANNGELSATEISKKFDITAQAISQHLKVLLNANLVKMDKHAQQHIYKINTESVFEIEDWAKQTIITWNKRFDALDLVLKQEKKKIKIHNKKGLYMANSNNKELTITRVFDAPRELVWKAWTDPKILEKWWGPRGVTNPVCEWNAKPGGNINIVMLAGKELGNFAGQKWPMTGTFKEVTPQSRIVYISNALDDVKNIMLEAETTVDFEELEKKTKMNLHVIVTKADEKKAAFALQGMEMGWNQSIDKLQEELERT